MMGHRLVLVVKECEITEAEAEQVSFVDCFTYMNKAMTDEDLSGGDGNDLLSDYVDNKCYSRVQKTY